jgi:hypothetical protein
MGCAAHPRPGQAPGGGDVPRRKAVSQRAAAYALSLFSAENQHGLPRQNAPGGHPYYAASPAPIGSCVTVRIFDEELQVLDPRRMEILRRHPRSTRPGSLMMKPEDRIFNPSRETDELLSQAEAIGHTFSLCGEWFNEEGCSGQRRMFGLVNLVRH